MTDDNGYHNTRLEFDKRRNLLWKTLNSAFFSKYYNKDSTVLDIGCGHADFINNVQAKRRIALDQWEGFVEYLDENIDPIVGNIQDIDKLDNNSIDFVMASNIIEHVTQKDFKEFLEILRPKLRDGGTLNLVQPNYRYAYKEYFDDYTHISVYSHISLCDLLKANGYEVSMVIPKFLPLTIKSRLPVFPLLIRLYLKLPFSPMGKQMFIQAYPK